MNTPVFLYDTETCLEQYKSVNNVSDVVSYSSKTNPVVTEILEEHTDSYFSIHSMDEMKNVNDPSRTIFLAQAWEEDEIDRILSKGVTNIVVDNKRDLDKLKTYLEKHDVTINLSLRMKLKEYSVRTEKHFVFGMDSDTVNTEIHRLKENGAIERLGIHFHRKTQNISEWSYKKELEGALDKQTFTIIDHINIGGGIPSEYVNTNKRVIPTILSKIEDLKEWMNEQGIDLVIEPGRYISAPTASLKTTIKAIYKNNIVIDTSVYQGDMDALIVPVKLRISEEVGEDEGDPYVIKGKTPCSRDLFRYRTYLKNPQEGDELTFLNAGAYNFSTDFCSLQDIRHEIR